MDNIKNLIKDNYKILLILLFSLIIGIIVYTYYNYEYKKEYVRKSDNPEFSSEYSIKKYDANQYSGVTIELKDLIYEYYKDYINKSLNNPEEAYAMLTEESKKQFNNDIEKYKEYIKYQSSINTKNNKIIKYRENKELIPSYDIIDSEDNKFRIIENAIWDIEIEIKGKA